MRLFLIRHGESVDNVAGIYAGSRDSPLTNHGVLQARRLGAHLAARSSVVGPVQHFFVSTLQRAVRTAEAVAEAQSGLDPSGEALALVHVPELKEKDFGSEEGRRFGTRGALPTPKPADWVEPEGKDAMRMRVERFIDAYFVPTVLRGFNSDVNHSIAIVAHGIILNVLLRCLLARFGPQELTKLTRPGETPGKTEWLASWSNTGYLEADLRLRTVVPPATAESKTVNTSPSGRPLLGSVVSCQDSKDTMAAAGDARRGEAAVLEILMTVTTVNSVGHLQGLKKTRGGIGSAAFDQKQKTVDSFFARPVKPPAPVTVPSPVEIVLPVSGAQSVKGLRSQPQAPTHAQPLPPPGKTAQPAQPAQPVQVPQPVQAVQAVQPVQPTQAVQSPRPARPSKPAAPARPAQVTRPPKPFEPPKPVEQVKLPSPAESLQTMKVPQPAEATPQLAIPQPAKATRSLTNAPGPAKEAEPTKVTKIVKATRPSKVKRPVKKTRVFKKVRFALDVTEIA